MTAIAGVTANGSETALQPSREPHFRIADFKSGLSDDLVSSEASPWFRLRKRLAKVRRAVLTLTNGKLGWEFANREPRVRKKKPES